MLECWIFKLQKTDSIINLTIIDVTRTIKRQEWKKNFTSQNTSKIRRVCSRASIFGQGRDLLPLFRRFSSYLLYSSILSPHAKLEDSPLRTAPPAKKRQRGRLHATCRWSWLLAGESIIISRHSYTYIHI